MIGVIAYTKNSDISYTQEMTPLSIGQKCSRGLSNPHGSILVVINIIKWIKNHPIIEANVIFSILFILFLFVIIAANVPPLQEVAYFIH